MLQNPSVRNWLGGVEPAWTLLDLDSFVALHRPPSPTTGPIRLASDLPHEEIRQSAVARNALVLLRAAAADAGLKLTTPGNLTRRVVAEMHERIPGSQLAIIEDASHLCFTEQPAAFNNLVNTFLDRHEAGRSDREVDIAPGRRDKRVGEHGRSVRVRPALRTVGPGTSRWYTPREYVDEHDQC